MIKKIKDVSISRMLAWFVVITALLAAVGSVVSIKDEVGLVVDFSELSNIDLLTSLAFYLMIRVEDIEKHIKGENK